MEVFHQRNLREILSIHWTDGISNPAVLLRAGLPSTADAITTRRLTWLGHIARMEDTRLIKQLLFSQQPGQRQQQRPRFTLRRAMQQDVTTLHGGQPNGRSWFQECQDRNYWRQAIQDLANGVTQGEGARGSAHRTNRRLSRN
jgi:transcription termination factor 2